MKHIATILLLSGLLWSCDPYSILEPAPIEVEISNFSIEKTTITVLKEEVELDVLETHTFFIPGYLRSITIFAEGGYFQFYSKQSTILAGVLNKVPIMPNIGWIEISNFSSYVLNSPKYGNSFFLWNGNKLTDDGWIYLDFAETRYFKVTENTSQLEDITFSTPDGSRYKIVNDGIFPSVGSTKYVLILDSSYVIEL